MKALIKLTESNTLLKNGLQIQEINLQLKKNQNNGESLFKETLKVGKMFNESLTYFKSNDCKAILKENGNLIIKVEDFIWDCFGKKKAWFYKCIQAHKTTEKEKQSFINSNPPIFGVNEFLKFLKEGEETKETEKPILSLTYGDIKVKINSKNELTSDTSKEQLQAIITRLTAELSKIK
jgi:hypothetical protein